VRCISNLAWYFGNDKMELLPPSAFIATTLITALSTPSLTASPSPTVLAAIARMTTGPSSASDLSYPLTTCLPASMPRAGRWITIYTTTSYDPIGDDFHTYTLTATVEDPLTAICLTLTAPDQALPLDFSFYTTSCSTRPGTTYDIITTGDFSSGQVITLFPGEADQTIVTLTSSATAYTATHTASEEQISCELVPTEDNPYFCRASAGDWVAFILNIYSLFLNWWISNANLLLYGQFREFVEALLWGGLRSWAPECAAILDMGWGYDAGDWARIYFMGWHSGRDENGSWIPGCSFTYWMSFLGESATVAGVAMAFRQISQLPDYDPERTLEHTMMAFPTLPTAVIGLCLLAAEVLYPSRRGLLWMTYGVLLVVVIVLAVLVGGPFKDHTHPNGWIAVLIVTAFQSQPHLQLGSLSFVAGIWARSWPLFYTTHKMIRPSPYCKLGRNASRRFWVAIIVLTGVGGVVAALGWFLHVQRAEKRWKRDREGRRWGRRWLNLPIPGVPKCFG
jgi:hypothetical protein